MMSLETIRQLSQEAGREAAAEGKEPFVYFEPSEVTEYLERDGGFPFPFLGDYVPEGWEMVDTHFVDSSGFGAPDEPALTVNQFVAEIKGVLAEYPGTGWAVVEAGQFQVYVGEFRRVV